MNNIILLLLITLLCSSYQNQAIAETINNFSNPNILEEENIQKFSYNFLIEDASITSLMQKPANDKFLKKMKAYCLFNLFVPMEKEMASYKLSAKEGRDTYSICMESVSRRISIDFKQSEQNIKAKVNILLKWDELNKYDVKRSKSQIPFLAWRFSFRIKDVLNKILDKKAKSEFSDFHIGKDQELKVEKGLFANIHIETRLLDVPTNYEYNYKDQVNVIALMKLDNIGYIRRIIPATYSPQEGLTFALFGFQGSVKIEKIYSLHEDTLKEWGFYGNPYLNQLDRKFNKNNFEDLFQAELKQKKLREESIKKHEKNNIKLYLSPMVRYTTLVERQLPYEYKTIPLRVISEMALPGDLHMLPNESTIDYLTTLEFLNNGYRTDLSISEPFPTMQIGIPTTCRDSLITEIFCGCKDKDTKKYNKNIVLKSAIQVALNAKMLGYEYLNIDACCNSAKILKRGGGKDLINNGELFSELIKTIQEKVGIDVGVKILLPKELNSDKPDIKKTKALISKLANKGIKDIHIQATTTESWYYPDLMYAVTKDFPELNIFYNGNIVHKNDTGADENKFSIDDIKRLIPNISGVTIGRSFMGNPYFLSAKELIHDINTIKISIEHLKKLKTYYFGRQELQVAYMQVAALSYIYNVIPESQQQFWEHGVCMCKSASDIILIFTNLLSKIQNKEINT